MTNKIDPLDNFQSDNNDISKWQLILGGFILIVIIALSFLFYKIQKNSSFSDVFDNEINNILLQENYSLDDDGDGLLNGEEDVWGTDSKKVDTDNDGYSDYDEIKEGYNPLGDGKLSSVELNQKKDIINQNSLSIEKDTASIWLDSFLKRPRSDGKYNTLQERYADDDLDGVSNIIEQAYGLNPKKADTDGDGKNDGLELNNYENPFGPGTIPKKIVEIINNMEDDMLFFGRCDKLRSEANPSVDDSDECYLASAVLTNKTSYCEKTKSGKYDLSIDCYTNLAVINMDEEYCLKIPGGRIRNEYFDVGRRDSCFEEVALTRKDESICDNIGFGDSSNAFNSYAKYFCYERVAVENKNFKFCEEMLNLFELDMINYYLNSNDFHGKIPVNYIDESKNEANKILAEKLKIESYWQCLTKMIESSDNVDSCNIFSSAETREDCIFKFAEEKNDINLCKTITKSLIKESCLSSVGSQRIDATICHEIRDELLRNKCFEGVAKNTGRKEVCKNIKEEKRNNCYSIVAIETEDFSICNLMIVKPISKDSWVQEGSKKQSNSEYARDICYYNVGIKKKDGSICNIIINDFRRKSCLNSI